MWLLGIQTTYIFKNSMTSGDKGEAPDAIKRTRPPSLAFILLNTNLSHMGDGFLPRRFSNDTIRNSEIT